MRHSSCCAGRRPIERSVLRTVQVLGTVLVVGTLAACAERAPETVALFRAPPVANTVDGVVFESGNWEPHLAAGEGGVSWGNHRAVVELDAEATGADVVAVTTGLCLAVTLSMGLIGTWQALGHKAAPHLRNE